MDDVTHDSGIVSHHREHLSMLDISRLRVSAQDLRGFLVSHCRLEGFCVNQIMLDGVDSWQIFASDLRGLRLPLKFFQLRGGLWVGGEVDAQ